MTSLSFRVVRIRPIVFAQSPREVTGPVVNGRGLKNSKNRDILANLYTIAKDTKKSSAMKKNSRHFDKRFVRNTRCNTIPFRRKVCASLKNQVSKIGLFRGRRSDPQEILNAPLEFQVDPIERLASACFDARHRAKLKIVQNPRYLV